MIRISPKVRVFFIASLLTLLCALPASYADEAASSGWLLPHNASFERTEPLLKQVITTQKRDLSTVNIKAEQGYWFLFSVPVSLQAAVIYVDVTHLETHVFYALDDEFKPVENKGADPYSYLNSLLPHLMLDTRTTRWVALYVHHDEPQRLNIGIVSNQLFSHIINKKIGFQIVIFGLLVFSLTIVATIFTLSRQLKSVYLFTYLLCILADHILITGQLVFFNVVTASIWYTKVPYALQLLALGVSCLYFIDCLQLQARLKIKSVQLLRYSLIVAGAAILSCILTGMLHHSVISLSLLGLLTLHGYLFMQWQTRGKQAQQLEFVIAWGAVILQALCWQVNLIIIAPLQPLTEVLLIINAIACVVVLLIHERKSVKQYSYSLSHDDDTKLPNKQLLIKRLNEKIESAIEHSLVLFKPNVLLNARANFGYEHVNKNIQMIMGKLAQQLAPMNVLYVESDPQQCIVKLDDSTYAVVILGKLELSQVEQFVCVINSVFAQGISYKRLHLIDKVDIGVVNYPRHANSSSELIQRGLHALGIKPLRGERWHMFNIENVILSQQRIAIVSALKHAIEDNQLSLYFQPQLDLKTGKVHGSEALLRWQHPQLGNVPPDIFIPIAESSGMISDLTEWVITQALQYQKKIITVLSEHVISINISAKDLQCKDLPVLFITLLNELKLNPENIMLELTESATLFEGIDIKNALNDYRLIGVKVAIDDFGTGYSSLAYLSKMGFDEIKIDKQFVMNIEYSKNDQTICRATCDIAKSLGSYVVAEGIEDSQSLAKLQSYGCEIGQGYFFSRPLAFDDYIQWLEQHSNPNKIVKLNLV